MLLFEVARFASSPQTETCCLSSSLPSAGSGRTTFLSWGHVSFCGHSDILCPRGLLTCVPAALRLHKSFLCQSLCRCHVNRRLRWRWWRVFVSHANRWTRPAGGGGGGLQRFPVFSSVFEDSPFGMKSRGQGGGAQRGKWTPLPPPSLCVPFCFIEHSTTNSCC